jgi:malonate decarboxylase delta subunit
VALERLEFEYTGVPEEKRDGWDYLHVGHVMSGDLEILVERLPAQANVSRIRITTSAVGFGSVWQMVIDEFMATRKVCGCEIWINDDGATPAVVKLRLSQLAREMSVK